MWAQHIIPDLQGTSGTQRCCSLWQSLYPYQSPDCPFSFSFSCSRFTLQLRAQRSAGPGWYLSHTRAMLGVTGRPRHQSWSITPCHATVQGREESWGFHFIVCLQAMKQESTEIIFSTFFTQSPCLLGSVGILGHLTDGSNFHVHTQSFC